MTTPAIATTTRVMFIAGAPPLPEGYVFGGAWDTPNGIRLVVRFDGNRIFEIAVERSIDDTLRFAARVLKDRSPSKPIFNQPAKWFQFDDIATLMHSMLARHRIGVRHEHHTE